MSPVWLHARMKRLTLACFSTYVEDAVHQGHSKLSIRTVDTDVVVLAITSAQHLNISELWVLELERTSDILLLMSTQS